MITLHVCDKNRGIPMPHSADTENSLDRGIARLGRVISWCVPTMAFLVLIIVVLRYGFNTGAIAAQESVQYLHATSSCWVRPLRSGQTSMSVSIFSTGSSMHAPKGMGQCAGTHCVHVTALWSDWTRFVGLRADSWSAREASLSQADLPLVFVLKDTHSCHGDFAGPPIGFTDHRAIDVLRERGRS